MSFLPNKLPLFYSLPWGESQLASLLQFLILPAIMIIISLVNLALAWQLHPSQKLFQQILIAGSFISSLILVITIIKILFIFI